MTEAQHEFSRGWDEALDMVHDVIITMKNNKTITFDFDTLEELAQRIS